MEYILNNDLLQIKVAERGAELQSVLAADGTEYLWQGDAAYWPDRAINIFPYVARLTQEQYSYAGKIYKMPIHGFAPISVFKCREQTNNRLVMELEDNQETRKQFPFAFCFRVTYTLRGNTLEITYEVENCDEKTMYFGLGGHPGFNVPLSEGLAFEDYELRFDACCYPKRIGFTPQCFLDSTDAPFPLIEGKKISLRHDLFDEDAIVLKDMCHKVTLVSEHDSHSVTVVFPEMPYLGIWHCPKSEAPYVCIEPWSSLPATQDKITVLEEQPDLLKLEAGQSYYNQWAIQFDF